MQTSEYNGRLGIGHEVDRVREAPNEGTPNLAPRVRIPQRVTLDGGQ